MLPSTSWGSEMDAEQFAVLEREQFYGYIAGDADLAGFLAIPNRRTAEEKAEREKTRAERKAAGTPSGGEQFITGLAKGFTSTMAPKEEVAVVEEVEEVEEGMSTTTMLLIGGAVLGGIAVLGGLVYFATRS